MKLIHHKGLNPKKWHLLSFFEQMANIGSEVERTIIWKNKDRLKEILRVREVLADWSYFENEYNSTDKSWQKYFFAFNYAARVQK